MMAGNVPRERRNVEQKGGDGRHESASVVFPAFMISRVKVPPELLSERNRI
jgi:hypothetical protein